MSGAIPLLLLVACVAVALGTYALVRQARAAQQRRRLDDRDLYEAGEAAATGRKEVRLPRLTALLHETGREGSAVGWIAQLAALAFVAFAVATALSGRAVVGAGAGAAVLGAMGARLHLLRKRRQELLSQQFTRVLPQVAASVRSSLTLERALRTAASHVEDPLREEVARVLADAAYGTTLAEAFELMAARTGDPDVRALAAAVRIQQGSAAPSPCARPHRAARGGAATAPRAS